MFIKYIKELSLKKILKSTLKNVKPSSLGSYVSSVAVLIDETYFIQKNDLINELINFGIKRDNIKLLVYKDKIKKNEIFAFPAFSKKDLNWKGDFSANHVVDFLNTEFDLLISYYDLEKTPLLLATNRSKALFKVGFSTVDKRLNHLLINTNVENFKVFVHELFRYLKILNKI
jgi:hypothetical protein